MTARSGMSNLIDRLRSMAYAGTADYTLGTANFWDDNHVQAILDQNRTDFFELELTPVPKTINSALVYYRYDAPYGNLETYASGSAIFTLAKSDGTQAGTAAYTVDYTRGVVTFTADQGGTAWFLTGRTYDLNSAAADIWEGKASYYQSAYDVKTDGHDLSRSQLFKHAIEQAEKYRAMVGAYSVEILRGDEL